MESSPHQAYPLAPASRDPRSDADSLAEKEEKRKKRMKWIAYIAAFSVFQVIVILVFVLVVMKVRTPKFRIGTIRIQTLSFGNQSSPSFDMSFIAPLRVKNANFGPYKYQATIINFTYGGTVVGSVGLPSGKANFRSTKKVDLPVLSLNSRILSDTTMLSSDLSSGNLTLNSEAKMNGKVEIMLIFKKKKSTSMNCTITINVDTKQLQNVECK